VSIPHDPRVIGDAITRGLPFVTAHPEAEVSRAIRELVARIVPERAMAAAVPESGDRKRRKGLFGR